MKSKIRNICKDLEKEKNIKILFVVENGSRAWRMDSSDSDFDVRFVFVRPLEDYITIKKPRDVIEKTFDKDGNICKTEGSFIDLSGFDIFKYITLLASSNPTTIEWLVSDIVYYGKQNKILKDFALENFNPIALYYHYKSLCKGNYTKYIKSGNDVTYKRYLYSFRGLINAKWVLEKDTIPSIVFPDTINELETVPKTIKEKLNNIIEIKKSGKEKEKIKKIIEFDKYIESFISNNAQPSKKSANIDKIEKELRNIVLNQNNIVI